MVSLYPAHLCSLLWSPSLLQNPKLLGLCLASMLFTLRIWRTCTTRFSFSLPCPPLSNVLFSPIIPDSLSYALESSWAEASLFQLRQFVYPVTHRLRAFEDIQTTYHIPRHIYFSTSKLNLSTFSPSLILLYYFILYNIYYKQACFLYSTSGQENYTTTLALLPPLSC